MCVCVLSFLYGGNALQALEERVYVPSCVSLAFVAAAAAWVLHSGEKQWRVPEVITLGKGWLHAKAPSREVMIQKTAHTQRYNVACCKENCQKCSRGHPRTSSIVLVRP